MDFSIESKITKDFILSHINQETIFNYYLGVSVESKKLICNPFRVDKNPTCGFYKSRNGIVYFHDFALNKHYNCFNIVMEKYACTYHQALKIIASDFNLTNDNVKKKEIKLVKEIKQKDNTFIQVKIKSFSTKELEWWGKYGITEKILKKFNVYSCDTVFLNSNIIASSTENCPIYGYYGGKDKDLELWRIYFPKRKSYRFMSNWNSKKIQGFKQLPKEGKLLIITKSMKDTMCYYSLGIPAIAPNSETLFVSDDILNSLKNRFKYIIVHYDNDKAGKYNLAKIRKLHPELIYYFIPNSYKAKDISDFYKKYNREKTINFIKENLIWLSKHQKHLQKK